MLLFFIKNDLVDRGWAAGRSHIPLSLWVGCGAKPYSFILMGGLRGEGALKEALGILKSKCLGGNK
ncbi:MAG TPA: hypothetical protein DEA49_02020 [Petrotoga sp.]|nr:hypothetical protein [Petrotoga sp.]